MANKKTTKAKSPQKKVEVIEEAFKKVEEVKQQAQTDYEKAMASLVIVRN